MHVLLLGGITVIVILLFRACFLPLFRIIQINRAVSVVPVPEPAHWLLGHLPEVMQAGKDEERTTRYLADGKKIFRIDEVVLQEIILAHPETVATLAKTAEPKAYLGYGFLRPWLGNGLLISTGKRWARDRRLLTRGFHFDILRGYLPVYKDAVGYVLDQWMEACRQGNGEHTVNGTECSKQITLEVILRCIMSFNPHTQSVEAKKRMDQYVASVAEIGRLLHGRYMNPLLHPEFLFRLSPSGRRFRSLVKTCHTVSQSVIEERRRMLTRIKEEQNLTTQDEEIFALKKESPSGYLDFLDILLTVRDEDGRGLTDAEIQEQVDTFLFEGHDTTASALMWTLWYLAKHPDLQEKCRQDAESCLGNGKELSYENLGQLSYLTQFIKESLRLGAPVPYVGRTLSQPMEIGGYKLSAGATCTIAMLAVHRHPQVWEDPLRFDPERFSPENSADRHPYAFIPFSAGPRNCIGQQLAMDELKAVISHILLRFRLSVDPGVMKPRIEALMISRPSEDIKIQVQEI